MDDTFRLPNFLDPNDSFRFELSLMKESLRRRGISTESDEEVLGKLSEINQKECFNVSNRPPMPSDYFDAIPHEKWLGHGFFYKSGKGKTEMHKDNAYEDFDCFDNFCRLTKCQVLLADYDEIRKDFNLKDDMKNEEIDDWLITHFCYLSTGQINRMKSGGDLEHLVSEGWSEFVDEQDKKLGLRQRGGGRACTFFADDELFWNGQGRIEGRIPMDIKGNGVCIQQPKFGRKATGFLSYSDALKGMAFERAVRQVLSMKENEGCYWNTVHCYAIIDIGIRWRKNDPATGIEGDKRNCLLLRAAHSRYSGSIDEPVYYSVVQMDALKTEQGQRLINALRKVDCSTEQSPLSPIPLSWNIQCTSTFDTLVDFSQYYFFPGKRVDMHVLPAFRMSDELFKTTIRLQGEFTFRNIFAMELAYGTKDKEEAKKIFESMKPELEEKAIGYGDVGKGKPKISWSWQVDMDDCIAFRTIIEYSCGKVEKVVPLELMKTWWKM